MSERIANTEIEGGVMHIVDVLQIRRSAPLWLMLFYLTSMLVLLASVSVANHLGQMSGRQTGVIERLENMEKYNQKNSY